MMDFTVNQDAAANNDLPGTRSQPLGTGSQRRASSMMGVMLNQNEAANNYLQGNTLLSALAVHWFYLAYWLRNLSRLSFPVT